MSVMACPRCKAGGDVVALEDGVWMCMGCNIEFDVDGRARGGMVNVGKFGIFLDGSPSDPLFTANVSVSAPQKNGTVIAEIRMDSVGNVEELVRKLYELLKRAKGVNDG